MPGARRDRLHDGGPRRRDRLRSGRVAAPARPRARSRRRRAARRPGSRGGPEAVRRGVSRLPPLISCVGRTTVAASPVRRRHIRHGPALVARRLSRGPGAPAGTVGRDEGPPPQPRPVRPSYEPDEEREIDFGGLGQNRPPLVARRRSDRARRDRGLSDLPRRRRRLRRAHDRLPRQPALPDRQHTDPEPCDEPRHGEQRSCGATTSCQRVADEVG